MAKIFIDSRIIKSSTGRYVENLIRYLEKLNSDHDFTLIVRSKDVEYTQKLFPKLQVLTVDADDYSIDEQIKMLHFLNKHKPDLVHFTMPQQPVLYGGRKVTTFHDLTLLKTYNSDKPWLAYHIKQLVGRFVFSNVCKTSTSIIVPTEFVKSDLNQTFPQSCGKTTITYEASDVLSNSPHKIDLPFKDYLLYVGQQSDYKNIPNLAKAHQNLLKKYPNLGLVLVGKVNPAVEKNQKLFSKNNYKNIYFTGFVSNDQLAWLYKNCSVYTFPSKMEGFGLPGLEAMVHDAVVISSNATCLPEVYKDASAYFDPYDVDNMTKEIANLLSDKKLQAKLKENSKDVTKLYSWRKMAKETLEIYNKSLGN